MNNSQVAHHFIYDYSLANGSNFSCNNRKLYSYSSLMATIDRDRKIILIDERISHYSNSSQKHRNHLFKAIPSTYSVFEWRWQDGSFIECKYNSILGMIDKQSRARVNDYSSSIAQSIDLCKDYAKCFPDSISEYDNQLLVDINTINIQELLSSSAHLVESNKQRILALKEKENAKHQEARQNNLNKFLGTTDVIFDPNYNSVYLKVIGDTVYTSNSIQVQLSDAITLYKAYLSGKNILNAKLGSYTVVKASKSSVTIGCTTISAIELNRVLSKYLNYNFKQQIPLEPEDESFDDLLNQLDEINNDLKSLGIDESDPLYALSRCGSNTIFKR